MGIRVLLVDDHQMFRHALMVMLERHDTIEVVGELADGQAMMDWVAQQPVDVVCMDIAMPRLFGIEATRQLLKQRPGIKVIGVSGHTDTDYVVDMMRAGASGYVTKSASPEELVEAIHSVHEGRQYWSAEVAEVLHARQRGSGHGALVAERPRLGARERQVVQLVAEGYTTAQIAERLNVAFSTVGVHRRNIMRKLNMHKASELTRYAILNGLTRIDQ